MTLYMLKVHLQTFLTTPITQRCQILSCDILVANKLFFYTNFDGRENPETRNSLTQMLSTVAYILFILRVIFLVNQSKFLPRNLLEKQTRRGTKVT
jgi:hypothetical protein